MVNMIALISLLLVVVFSMLVVRIGAVALEMTGLSKETARFQAQSAFSGVGFTTSEAEYVVSHPVRRRIIRILIFVGSAGVVSAMATLLLTFIGQSRKEATSSLAWLLIGLFVIYLFARSKIIDRGLRWLISRALEKFTGLKVYDYEQLLGLSKGYSIGKFKIRKGSWMDGEKLKNLRFDEEGVIALAIYRKVGDEERYLGAPAGDTELKEGDVIICYGPDETIKGLSCRLKGKKGNEQHLQAVEKEKVRREYQEIEFEDVSEK